MVNTPEKEGNLDLAFFFLIIKPCFVGQTYAMIKQNFKFKHPSKIKLYYTVIK